MKLYRPGFPPQFIDEPAEPLPAPKGPLPPLDIERAMLAAQARHIAAHGALPQQPQTQIIPTVEPQRIIDNHEPPPVPVKQPPVPEPQAPAPEKPAEQISNQLTPEEEAELDELLAKKEHSHPPT